jgi:hypothetical protein
MARQNEGEGPVVLDQRSIRGQKRSHGSFSSKAGTQALPTRPRSSRSRIPVGLDGREVGRIAAHELLI